MHGGNGQRPQEGTAENPLLAYLRDLGCSFQGNLGSFTGFYGDQVKAHRRIDARRGTLRPLRDRLAHRGTGENRPFKSAKTDCRLTGQSPVRLATIVPLTWGALIRTLYV